MRIHYLQHVPFEGPGSIADWCKHNGHELRSTRLYADEALPELNALDFLVVLGGPMGVADEGSYTWLAREKRFIQGAIDAGLPVLGICLGAQLIADVLGAEVRRNPHVEIGWFRTSLTAAGRNCRFFSNAPAEFPAFHWHGDTFAIPAGAQGLAFSEACANQAFMYADRVLGLQFHLETQPANVRSLLTHCGDELVDGPWIQSAEVIQATTQYLDQLATINYGMLDEFEAIVLALRHD